jgi:hypothetical protein
MKLKLEMEAQYGSTDGGFSMTEILIILTLIISFINSILSGLNFQSNCCGKPCQFKVTGAQAVQAEQQAKSVADMTAVVVDMTKK